MARDLEAHSLRLHDMQRLEVIALLERLAFFLVVLLDEVRQEVVPVKRRRLPLTA